jgi:hypothetical protein
VDRRERGGSLSRAFIVVSEARADFEQATELADRVLLDAIDWLEEMLLDTQRRWVGDDPYGGRLTWKSIRRGAHALGINVRGHFDDKPGEPDAKSARRAIAYVRKRFNPIDAILLIRDLDDQPQRRQGLEQARDASRHVTVVIGAANVERECWVLSGFVPETDDETKKLESERQSLGFHPCERSHRLTAGKNNQAIRSPKRVLAILTAGNRERERRCWVGTPLTVLRDRGQQNGLADYLIDARDRLVPLVAGH